MNYRARLLGKPRPIPDEDLAQFTRPGTAPQMSNRIGALWRYYLRFTGIIEG